MITRVFVCFTGPHGFVDAIVLSALREMWTCGSTDNPLPFPRLRFRSPVSSPLNLPLLGVHQPSDCMKEEMENLVKKLGADGVEAKRQVNKRQGYDTHRWRWE